MQVQNSKIESENIYEKLVSISDQIITYSQSGREYKHKGILSDAYTFVYDQCTSKPSKSENMFNKYKEILALHFINYIKSASIQYDEHVFRQTNKLWNAYIKFARILSKQVFTYLDRYFLPSRQHGNLIDVAVAIFDKNVFGNEAKKKVYIDCFADSIKLMRRNMIITQNHHIHEFTKQIYAINTDLYFQIKKKYVEQTRAFYQQKFGQLKSLDPLYFYNSLVNLIYFEETLSTVCLYWTNEEMLKQRIIMPIIFTKQLVEPYTTIFLNHSKGFLWALKSFHLPLLNLITDIYSKFQGFDKIKKFYYDYIVEESKQLMRSLDFIQEEDKIVGYITKFFNKHQTILTAGFKKHQEIYVTLSNALQFGIGKWDKLSEILFKFCEKVVATGSFDHHSQTIKAVFEKVGSKDQFIHKCENWVQQTILYEKMPIKQLHKFAIFLHELCGSQNTNKLNKLVNDYIEQNQENINFNNFSCKVISHHLWERRFKQEVAVCLTLPQNLQSSWNNFVASYSSIHNKKTLQLLPLSSRIILNLKFSKHLLTVKCNLLQASILLSLEENPKTEEQLIIHINTEKHLINSFVASAKFITIKDEKLTIDWNFEEEGFKDYTEQFQQKSKFIKAIEQDRNILLQAGIVRMIKRRKEASFEEIFDYLCHAIKLFRPQPHMVKTTIEKLIKRDFIETNEQGLYLYKE